MTEEQDEMLKRLLEITADLSNFEEEFVESLVEQSNEFDAEDDDDFELTEKQAEKLQEIYTDRIIRRKRH